MAFNLSQRDNDNRGADDVTAAFVNFSVAGINAILSGNPLPDPTQYNLSQVSTRGFISPNAAFYIELAAPAMAELANYLKSQDENDTGRDDNAATLLIFIAAGLDALAAGAQLPDASEYFGGEVKAETNALLDAEL